MNEQKMAIGVLQDAHQSLPPASGYIGPAIVVVIIGLLGASVAAFAVYPVQSVLFLWTWFSLTSQVAQALGKYLGIETDKDGDVHMLDFLY